MTSAVNIRKRMAGKLPYDKVQEPVDHSTYESVKPDVMGNKGETNEIPLDGGPDKAVYHMDSAQQMRSRLKNK